MKNVSNVRKFTVISTIFLLICGIATTLAWYTVVMINNGILDIPIDTQVEEGIVLAFTPFSELEGVLAPAQMKAGVINNYLKETDGKYQSGLLEILDIPDSTKVLPQVVEYTDGAGELLYYSYAINNDDYGNLVPSSDYLTYPATALYRQFEITVGAITEGKRNANFSISIQYLNSEGKFSDLKQTDAFNISFHVLQTELTNANLSSISTDRFESDLNNDKVFQTFSEMMYKNQKENYLIYPLSRSGKRYLIADEAELFNVKKVATPDGGTGYTIEPNLITYKDGTFSLDFTLENIIVNQKYFLLIYIYYNLPDELLDGDLLITDEIVLNVRYSLETVVTN